MKIKTKNTTLQVRKFDPLTCSKEEWKQYHKIRKMRSKEENPDDPISSDDSVEKAIKANMEYPEANINLNNVIDTKSNDQIGTVEYVTITKKSPSYEGTKHLFQYDIYLTPEYRRQKIGTKIMDFLYKKAKELGKTTLMTGTSNDEGKSFLKEIGTQTALSGIENRLYLKEVNWNMINEWVNEGLKKSEGTQLKVFEKMPEEILEQYCKIYTEVLNQQPLGELDVGAIIMEPKMYREQEKMFEQMGRTWLTLIAIEKDGKISGLTEMRYNPNRETIINQLLTGVKQEYRGKGVGKWLKASMLLKIKKKFPKVEIVSTGNATTNAPMLSINKRLGFKKHKETISAQISIDKLGKYLKNNC